MKETIKEKEIKLKRGIRKETIIKDLYDDGEYYYKVGKTWIPTDFNNFKHPDYCESNN